MVSRLPKSPKCCHHVFSQNSRCTGAAIMFALTVVAGNLPEMIHFKIDSLKLRPNGETLNH